MSRLLHLALSLWAPPPLLPTGGGARVAAWPAPPDPVQFDTGEYSTFDTGEAEFFA